MPVLPTAIDLTRASARPSTAVPQYNPGAVEEATANFGREITRTADRVVDIQHRLARLHAQDALVELKRTQNELTFGENGYSRLQNGAAAAPGVYKKYEDLHRAAVSAHAENLSPLAKQYFERDAKEMGDNFQAGFLRHALSEELKHRGAVFNAASEVSAQTAALNYNNPEVLAREKVDRNRILATYFAENGVTDPKVREALSQKVHGEAHEAVVRAMLTNDDVKGASAYLKENRQEMTHERAQALDNAMKSEVAADDARDIATEMYNMRIKGASEVQIQQRKLELTQGKGSTTSNFVDNVYGDLVRAKETDERRAVGSLILESMNGGLSPKDPRLIDLKINNPALALQVQKAINSQAKAAAGGDAKPGKVVTDMKLYSEISEAIRNGEDIDENDIYSHAGTRLTNADAKSLAGKLGSRNTTAGKFKIPSTLLNSNTPKSAGNKDRKDAYKGFVELKLDAWKEENPGKIPTAQQQVEILQSASEEYVAVDAGWFGRDVKEEAYRLEPGVLSYPKRYDTMLEGFTPEQKAGVFTEYKNRKSKNKNDNRTEAQFIEDLKTRIQQGVK